MDAAAERREGALTANRIRELVERPLHGQFDLDHLRAVHAYIFQDLPTYHPGEVRDDSPGWSKFRRLEGQLGVHEVHYAHDSIEQRARTVLQELGGPETLAGLSPDAFAARVARLYGDLDHVHAFYEGNSRTLREFTREFALASGYNLSWSSTSVDAAERNRLYVARDIAVLERAFPGITPERGMQTNDRAEYEASLALPGLRLVPGADLETIVRAGLMPLSVPAAETSAGHPAKEVSPAGIASMALAALARHRDAAEGASPPVSHTPIADRPATGATPATAQGGHPERDAFSDSKPGYGADLRKQRGPEPGF